MSATDTLSSRPEWKVQSADPKRSSCARHEAEAPTKQTQPKVWDGAPLTCLAVRDEAPGVKTFCLAPQDGSRVRFHAGQNLTLAWAMPDGERLHRTFTVASAPTETRHVELTVKAHPGGRVTNDMHARLVPGTMVEASGVGGRFGLAFNPADRVLLIGAGSGLTPMMSMLRLMRDRGHTLDTVFIQCARTPSDLLFVDELAAATATLATTSVLNIVDEVPRGQSFLGPRGRLGRALLHALVPDARRRAVFLCGPPPFMESVTRILRAEGCDPSCIHTERFTAAPVLPPAEAERGTMHPVTLTRSHRTVSVPADKTILSALNSAGLAVPSACRLGICGTCRVGRTAGEVVMTHQGGLSPAQEAAGDVLTCCSYATGPLTLEL